MKRNLFFAVAAGVLMMGCVNYGAVSEFADQTSKVTGVVRSELTQLDGLCKEQAELTIVVNHIEDDGPLNQCKSFKQAQDRLQGVTIDVLDSYTQALRSLADGTQFKLDSNIDDVAHKVKSLQDKSGAPMADANVVTALTQITEALANAFEESRRESAVKRLIAEKPNLITAGQVLRTYFGGEQEKVTPYLSQVGLISDQTASVQKTLSRKSFQDAEPIRSFELLRSTKSLDERVAIRSKATEGNVRVAVVAALDAWLKSLDHFTDKALEPDPKELKAAVKDVRTKVKVARDAIHAANE